MFETYWRLAAERQEIFHRRCAGEPGPWTRDPILAHYKFCNAYRASDRVSQYLIREVIYGPCGAGLKPEDSFMRIVLFRIFSKENTWEVLEAASGGLRRDTFDVGHLSSVLSAAKERGPIYTAAFILCAANPYGFTAKHQNHLELVRRMFAPGGLGAKLARAKSLQDVYGLLIDWPMIGPFLAYQLAIDLNYSEHLNFSEDEFTVPGPGAMRGLEKVFADFGGSGPADLIMWMVDQQEEQFERLGLRFQDLFGRRLHAIDCQGLFCETDKYARVAFPGLKSNRHRIKQVFTPGCEPPPLFYPPKWGVNDRLPQPRALVPC